MIVYNLGVETGGFLGLPGWAVETKQQALGSARDLISISNLESNRREYQKTTSGVHTCTHRRVLLHIQVYT